MIKEEKRLLNFAIYRKDLTRFWPVWLIELAALQLIFTLPLISQIGKLRDEVDRGMLWAEHLSSEIEENLCNMSIGLTKPAVIACISILMAIFMFSYLTREREAYMMHSFPVKRNVLFLSHYLAGVTMMVGPYAVTYLAVICIAAGNGAGKMTIPLMLCLAEMVIEMLLFYNLGCLVAMLTGNSIMTVIIYAVLNVLYAGVTAMYSFIGEKFIYGYDENGIIISGTINRILTPVWGLTEHAGLTSFYNVDVITDDSMLLHGLLKDFGYIACYLIPAAIFLILAVVLYQKRSLEAAGDMVAFSWGRPVFRIVFTFCGSILFALSIYEICFDREIDHFQYRKIFQILLVLVIIGGILCYLISNMILYKSFRIWKRTSYLRMGILVGVIVCGMFFMKLGNEGRIPNPDQVVSLKIEMSLGSMEYVRHTQFYFYDKEELEAFGKIEREILKEGPDLGNYELYSDYIDNIYVTYNLKNGRTISRYYPMLSESYPSADGRKLFKKVKGFIYSTQNMCYNLFGIHCEKADVSGITIYHYGGDGLEDEIFLEEQTKRDQIYAAVLKDIKANRYHFEADPEEGLANIDIDVTNSYYLEDVSGENGDTDGTHDELAGTVSFVITEECTETIKALKELKLDSVLEK